VAIEKSPKLASRLRQRFPQAHVITGDALDLDRLLEKPVRRVSDVAVVFSSLPLRNLEPRDATRLVNKIRAVLRPDGLLIQYSYHLGNKQASALAQFRQINSDIIWLNLPPARVNAYQEFHHRRSLVRQADVEENASAVVHVKVVLKLRGPMRRFPKHQRAAASC
jgi:phospholipid N-methyltransferase